ncbi:MAG: alpha/beta hydrolase family esterase [Pseudonocardia sp.]
MTRWIGSALVGLTLLAGCAQPAGSAFPPAVDRTVNVPSAEGDREALVHHPVTAQAGAPLVVVLHGAGVSPGMVRDRLGWNALADREGFVVAYPSGLDQLWNAGACCGRTAAEDVDDPRFLHELTVRMTAEDRIDVHRVFAVGVSNGGMLAYAWACGWPGELAGIGVIAGARVTTCPAPEPISVVAVHGTADQVVPLAGGTGTGQVRFPPLDGSLGPFHAAAGCPGAPQVSSEGPATVSTWRCPGGRTVVRNVIEGLSHAWPGAGPEAGTNDGPADATGFVWSHLRGARS